jgi:3',5'-nucleoside bisphosphate phosphatase
MKIAADLHIHSALSPCGSLDMSPSAIVQHAQAAGLDLIAVCDHNSVDNSFTAAAIGARCGLRVICGMEAQTQEDVHLLCLFDEPADARSFYSHIYPALPDVANNPDFFGDQVVVDEEDNIVRVEPRLLINSLSLPISRLAELVGGHHGYVVPSHVDRLQFGVLPVLGFLPAELADCVLEVSSHVPEDEVTRLFPELAGKPWVTNSDAHYLCDIGRAFTIYEAEAASVGALLAAARAGRASRVLRR